jgi:acylphosphatase
MRPAVVTYRYRITGRVQGVGYRYFALTEAHALGIAGYAKNLADGSVEVVAEGEPAAMQAFEARLGEGPAFSRVEIVDKAPIAGRGDQGFHIR